MELILLLALAAWAAVFGPLVARQAWTVDRSVVLWAAFGAVLGPVALALLNAAPPGRCRRCDTRVRGWDYACRYCGEDVRGVIPTPVIASRADTVTTPPASPSASRATIRHSPPDRPVTAVAPRVTPSPARAPTGPPARRRRRAAPEVRTVGYGLFLTGSASLLPGFRYAIGVTEARLQVMGPLEQDPQRVVIDRDLGPFEATAAEGRLMLTEGPAGRPRMFLVFDGVDDPETVADAIMRAVQAVPRAG